MGTILYIRSFSYTQIITISHSQKISDFKVGKKDHCTVNPVSKPNPDEVFIQDKGPDIEIVIPGKMTVNQGSFTAQSSLIVNR